MLSQFCLLIIRYTSTNKLLNELIKINIFLFSVYIIFIYIILIFLSNTYIVTDSFYYSVLENQYSFDTIERMIISNKRNIWLTYFFAIFFLLLKLIFTSVVLYIGIKLFELKINFNNCFRIVLLAEFIPILTSITKNLYFYIYPPNNIESLQTFNPLGISYLFKSDSIPKYLLYPIQQLNLFEVAYWILLAYGIKSFGNIDFKKALKATTLSYGVCLLIWSIFIVFLQIQFS